MKSICIILAALSFKAHAFLKTRALDEIEGPIVCLNNETYHPEDYIPAARVSARADVVQIDAYAHILISQASNEPAKRSTEAKFQMLNWNFEPWGYHFNLKGVTIVISPEWASGINVEKYEKQKALRRGNYQALNVYMVETANSAECSYPRPASEKLTDASVVYDGCFVPLALSVTSATITHEVGHWMGLAHVFEGGCDSNDGCDDTFPQADPSYGKLQNGEDKKSCPVQSQCSGNGKQNVLNYVSERCKTDALRLTTCRWTTAIVRRSLQSVRVDAWMGHGRTRGKAVKLESRDTCGTLVLYACSQGSR
jgi:hypothetical protein